MVSAKVVSVNRDDSYDLEYDDGDFEKRVPADKIRRKGGDVKRSTSPDSRRKEPEVYRIGDKVEALFKGGTKWFPPRWSP